MDTFDLTSLLTNLQLQSSQAPSEPPPFSQFTLFPNLPTELRLKILSHALTLPSTLPLDARVTIADPSFGLYITFGPAARKDEGSTTSFTSTSTAKPEALRSARAVDLLLVNRQCHALYTARYPLSLPAGRKGVGKIRFAPHETIYIQNFALLLADADFALAVTEGYRRQDFWAQIQSLAAPFTSLVSRDLMPRPQPAIAQARVLALFPQLREVRAVMWDGFHEQAVNVMGGSAVRQSFKWQLLKLSVDLDECRNEKGMGGDGPMIVLV